MVVAMHTSAFPSSSLRVLVLLAWLSLPLPSALPAAEPRHEEVLMPARDGVELATSVYLPAEGGPRWPCVLARTPYGKDGNRGVARDLTGRGYAFVSQDCRGKHKSKGKYDPFRTDHLDGHDAVEWVARQPWSDGKVGMMGGSALGITSHLAATQAPPHLLCAYVIVAEGSARHNTVYMGGVYRKELNDGWLAAQGAMATIGESVRNPPSSPHWDWRELALHHRKVQIPIYEVGGWFDIFAQGSIDTFGGLQASAGGIGAGNQKLVMGPWAHGALGGRLKFPEDRAGELIAGEHLRRWFDRWLKGEENGIDREPPVRYYVLGDPEDKAAPGNEWRSAAGWPPLPARITPYYLRGGGRLAPAPAPVPAPAAGEPSKVEYAYDPKSPVPTKGGANLILGGKGPIDQREVGERQDYLRFATEPLESPFEVIGRIYVDLHVESDAPDTDFAAKLVDVYPDGYEALITDGILRARYREGFEKEVFLEPGKVVPLRIDLWSAAIVFNAGHRVAVHVTSSNDPRFDPNPNTGKPTRADSETRVARNAVHHSARYPSRVLLPVTRVYGETRRL
ncbi:MAG: CocE/NonD family hydrolase [Planctomycetes bacterium]|nr:CocE/NonD family hydrolase [Planctomycetota bacterium]